VFWFRIRPFKFSTFNKFLLQIWKRWFFGVLYKKKYIYIQSKPTKKRANTRSETKNGLGRKYIRIERTVVTRARTKTLKTPNGVHLSSRWKKQRNQTVRSKPVRWYFSTWTRCIRLTYGGLWFIEFTGELVCTTRYDVHNGFLICCFPTTRSWPWCPVT